jgi:hypothetical protein
MLKDRLSEAYGGAIMPAVPTGMPIERGIHTYRFCMERRDFMTTRTNHGRPVRPISDTLAAPRELFGESLPELLLVTAIVVAVVGGVLALNGVG